MATSPNVDVAKIKWIEQQHMDLLSGYIRNHVSKNLVIPEEILQMCLLFYLVFEHWDENHMGDYMEITNQEKTISRCTLDDKAQDRYSNYQTVLANVLCIIHRRYSSLAIEIIGMRYRRELEQRDRDCKHKIFGGFRKSRY